MTQIRRFHLSLDSLSNLKSIRIFLKQCSIIVVNYSDLRINSKFLNKKLNKEDCLFLKYYHLRKRSYTKRQRKWLINTLGLFITISLSMMSRWNTAAHLCNSNQKFSLIKSLINTFMKQLWYFQPKYSKMLSIKVTFLSWKKRSTDYSDRMHLIFHREFSLMKLERRNILNSRILLQRKIQMIWLRGLKWDSEFLSKEL